jgi:hypothetical protein
VSFEWTRSAYDAKYVAQMIAIIAMSKVITYSIVSGGCSSSRTQPRGSSFQTNPHYPKHQHALIVRCADDKAANACYWHAEDGSRWILCRVHARTCELHAVVGFVSVCDRDVDCSLFSCCKSFHGNPLYREGLKRNSLSDNETRK